MSSVWLSYRRGKKHKPKISIIKILGAVVAIILLFAIFTEGNSGNDINEGINEKNNSLEQTSSNVTEEKDQKSNTTEVINQNMVTDQTRNLKVDQVVNDKEVYVALSYVKRTDKYSYLDTQESVDDSKEIMYLFFEIYNASGEIISFNPEEITCYADKNQMVSYVSNFFTEQDGITEKILYTIDSNNSAIIIKDFVVPKNWKDIDIFYDDFSWHLTENDVGSEPYANDNVTLTKHKHDSTPEGTVIAGGDYEARYDGVTIITPRYSEDEYIVFKFHVENKSKEQLDFSYAGPNIRAYHNNIYMGTADYGINDVVDGYSNMYYINSIEADMSADVYVAFECDFQGKAGEYMLTFDADYVTNNVEGEIYSNVE